MRSNFFDKPIDSKAQVSFASPISYPVKSIISHIVILGDSLSDRGTLAHRYLLHIVPMTKLSGLAGTSPSGRFTNGFVWTDDISAMFASEFIIRRAKKNYAYSEHKKYKFDPTDFADAIITAPQSNQHPLPDVDITDVSDSVIANRYFKRKFENSYTLDNDLYVQYHGRNFIRSYDEGGLSAFNYRRTLLTRLKISQPITSFKVFFSRLILSNLNKKRKAMLAYDKKMVLSMQQKGKTLVVEWSGANDLITVNIAPTTLAVDNAVKARMANVEKLIQQGYRKFILFNLPDLSLTPRLQNMTGKDADAARQNARHVCDYFTQQLQITSALLQNKYQHLNISVQIYDVNKLFTEVYNDTLNGTKRFPVAFDKDKLRIPFVNAPDFVNKNHLSPASGYMFWNDVHPSADMQSLLAEEFYKTLNDNYLVASPKGETAEMLCATFRRKIFSMEHATTLGRCSLFNNNVSMLKEMLAPSKLTDPTQTLVSILQLAIEANDKRVCKAMTDLQWLDAKGNVNMEIPALRKAKATLSHSTSKIDATADVELETRYKRLIR